MADKKYTSESKLNTFLEIEIEAGHADDAILQATALIDKLTGRNFIADTTETERLFDGKGTPNLLIDDCISISEVKAGSDYYGDSKTTLASTDYMKMPNNYAAKELPISQLHYKNAYWQPGIQNHSVKAKWGFSLVAPKNIELAATILAAGIYQYNRGGGSGDVSSESIGNYSVSYANEEGWKNYKRALTIIQSYKKWNL